MRTLIFGAILLAGAGHWAVVRPGGTDTELRLAAFPRQLGDWMAVEDLELGAEIVRMTGADQVVSRRYLHVPSGAMAEVFLGYFASQAPGVLADREPHLPTVCLPAAGWAIARQDLTGDVARMEITSGRERRDVYFWHQTRERVFANPLWMRWYGPLERWRTGRNDVVLTRVLLGAGSGGAGLVPVLRVGISKWISELPSKGWKS